MSTYIALTLLNQYEAPQKLYYKHLTMELWLTSHHYRFISTVTYVFGN